MGMLLALPIQLLVYLLLVRFAFRLGWGRAVVATIIRVIVGTLVFVLVYGLTDRGGGHPNDWPLAPQLLVSSVVAWALVSPIDPRRSLRRTARWVVVGTVVSMALHLAYWSALGFPMFKPM